MAMVNLKDSKFIRDTNSMGLSNINYQEREEYYARSRMISSQKKEIGELKNELNGVKDDISQIKSLLMQLLEK